MVFEFANECKDAVADVRSDTSDTNWAVRHSPRAGGRARVPACSLPPGTQPPRATVPPASPAPCPGAAARSRARARGAEVQAAPLRAQMGGACILSFRGAG